MINLSDQITELDAKIMDDCPVTGFSVADLHFLRCLAFATNPCLDVANFLLDPFADIGSC